MRTAFQFAAPANVTPAGAAAVSQRGLTLPDGSGPTAIQVDNRSGFWLLIYPGATFVPPYTLAAVIAFPGGAPSVDILFAATGPTGQVSSIQGDAISTVTVTLYDAAEAPPATEGTAYIAQFTPILTSETHFTTSPISGSTITLAVQPIPQVRYRLRWATFTYDEDTVRPMDSPQAVVLQADHGTPVNIRMRIAGVNGNFVDHRVFDPGVDYPFGAVILGLWSAQYAAADVIVTLGLEAL